MLFPGSAPPQMSISVTTGFLILSTTFGQCPDQRGIPHESLNIAQTCECVSVTVCVSEQAGLTKPKLPVGQWLSAVSVKTAFCVRLCFVYIKGKFHISSDTSSQNNPYEYRLLQ